jgi:hypothetical protein
MSTYKSLFADDVNVTVNPVHESISMTGSIISSSTYSDSNILNSSTNYFQTVYDYPYLSASSNQLFDTTFGFTTSYLNYTTATDYAKKNAVYSQLAHMLVGHDATGSIYKFDRDADKTTGDDKFDSLIFLNMSRLIYKDSLRKGQTQIKFLVGSGSNKSNHYLIVGDTGADTSYYTDSPVGDYGLLKFVSSNATAGNVSTNTNAGFVFYDAGVIAVSTGIFALSGTVLPTANVNQNQQGLLNSATVGTTYAFSGSAGTLEQCIVSSSIPTIATEIRKRIDNISIQNTTELRSTTYFCRVGSRDFNYSSNPTYLSSSQIRVVGNISTNAKPHSYVTSVGLYSPQNELLAVAKVSEPIKKTFGDEFLLKIRLDF